MSKEKPEVGDVWEDNNTKKPIYVFGIYKTSWGEYVCWCSYWEKDLELINENVGKKLFLQNYTYLGKSKINIKELFDVVDTVNDTVNDIVKDRSDNETN